MKNKLWKLAKMLIQFKEYETEQGKLIVSGEVVEGTEVAVENENGELIPAENGEYKLDEATTIVVEDGKIVEVKGEEPVEEPTEEPVKEEMEETSETQPDEKDLKIQELEGLLADRDAIIEELTAKIKELEEQINKPVEEPVKMAKVAKETEYKSSGAMKYFQN
jgi:hypothetical protein